MMTAANSKKSITKSSKTEKKPLQIVWRIVTLLAVLCAVFRYLFRLYCAQAKPPANPGLAPRLRRHVLLPSGKQHGNGNPFHMQDAGTGKSIAAVIS